MPKETKVIQKCRETLRAVFGHEDYREGQEAIIEALLEGRDVAHRSGEEFVFSAAGIG